MKMFDVALFKHFIESKGMVTVYINMYRKNHLKENPISIEEFLANVDASKVCTKAFYFVANSNYGFDYWTRIQEMWMEFHDANTDNFTADEWWKLQGMSKILRTNWDAAKHWKQESRMTAAVRLGVDLSLLGCEDKTPTAPQTKLSEEFLREKHLQEMANPAPVKEDDGVERLDIKTYIKGKEEEKQNIFGEFEFLELRSRNTTSHRRLADDEVSVNTNGDSYRITFNLKISKEIKERGGYEYAALLKNKTGDVALILNDIKGVTIQDGGSRSNAVISSKALVEKVVKMLNIENGYEIIKVTEVEKTNDYVAYILTKFKD